MDANRSAVLERVRQAVAQGKRVGEAPPLPTRGTVGYQGAGGSVVQRFADELTAAGGKPHIVSSPTAALSRVLELVQSRAAQRVVVGRGSVIDGLDLSSALRQSGLEVNVVDALGSSAERDIFFQADVGISGVAWAIAETGTLIMAASTEDPRSLSLLPPVHIAVVSQAQILPDLFDLFSTLEPDKANLPSCLSLITGPSKTGDIELKLVTGVHGPGEVHVIIIGD